MTDFKTNHWQEIILQRAKVKGELSDREERLLQIAVSIIIDKDTELIMWWKKVMEFHYQDRRKENESK